MLRSKIIVKYHLSCHVFLWKAMTDTLIVGTLGTLSQ